jgi:maleate cis-trans isomerase
MRVTSCMDPEPASALIAPSGKTVCEPEMPALRPDGVAAYATRIAFEPTIAGLRAMNREQT